jgi:hypothetical protein
MIGFSVIFTILVIAPLTYMLADNQPPYEYLTGRSYLTPLVAKQGSQMTVHWELRVNRYCPGVVSRTIIDEKTGVRISYDPVLVIAEPGVSLQFGPDRVMLLNRSFTLPLTIDPGPKLYRAYIEFHCNPLQFIWPLRVKTPDLEFVVPD